ncbi:MAG: thiamine pyrophosphate-dependent enzyme [bacterium]|nr:thiamine pyrophosphate-dependent enzyme [bacterium]
MTTDLVVVLDADGRALRGRAPKLASEQLTAIYDAMVRSRVLDEGASELGPDELSHYEPTHGREAIDVGATFALQDSDWIVPRKHQPAALLARGVLFEELANAWLGKIEDPTMGRQLPGHYSFRSANFLSTSSTAGSHLSHAVGAGIGARARGDDTVFLTFCDVQGTSSNDFHAGLNLAAVHKAPVVFVVEHAPWEASERETASATIAAKGAAYGIPGVRVDGHDVLAVYRACREAVDRARRGDGPTLVEACTWLTDGDTPAWRCEDPIKRFEQHLAHQKLWDAAIGQRHFDTATAELAEAIALARTAGDPDTESLFDDVFMNLSPQLREQRRELARTATTTTIQP